MKYQNISKLFLVTFLYTQMVVGVGAFELIEEIARQKITLSGDKIKKNPIIKPVVNVAMSTLLTEPYATVNTTIGITSVISQQYKNTNFNFQFGPGNIGNGLSLCPTAGCTTDVWGGAKGTDISSIVALSNLSTTGLYLVILASAGGNYVADVSQTMPDTLYLLVYDGTTPTTPLKTITVTSAATNFVNGNTAGNPTTWSNNMWIGGFAGGNFKATYPFVLSIKSVKAPAGGVAPTLTSIQSMDYSQLAATVALNPVTVTGISSAPAFDFTYGYNSATTVVPAGYWFGTTGSNGWNSTGPTNDLTSLYATANWASGVTLVTLPFDNSNPAKLIVDVTKTVPTTCYVFVYDTAKGTALGSMMLQQSNAGNAGTHYFSDSAPWSNVGQLAVGGVSTISNITHPMALTFNSSGTPAITVGKAAATQLSTLMTAAASGYEAFKTALTPILTLGDLSVTNSGTTYPNTNFNFSFGGYMFFGDFSGGDWPGVKAIGMPTLDWTKTTNIFVMIASDASGNILSTIPATPPTFTLFIFSGTSASTATYSTALTIDSSYAYQHPNAKSSGGNVVAIGGTLAGSATYPFAYIINPLK